MVRFEREDMAFAGKVISLAGTMAAAASYLAASDGSLNAVRHSMSVGGVTGSASAISAGCGALAITALAMAYYACAKAVVGQKRADDWVDRHLAYTATDGTHRLRMGAAVFLSFAALGSASLGGTQTYRALSWFLPPDNPSLSKTKAVSIPQNLAILPLQDNHQTARFLAPEIMLSPSINSEEIRKTSAVFDHAPKAHRPPIHPSAKPRHTKKAKPSVPA